MDLQPVGAAAVGEDHDVGVRRRDEEVADEVLFARAHADAALAAAALRAVGRDRRPLDVAGVRDRDRHVLVGDQVLDAELAALLDDLGAALVAELLANRLQLVEHDAASAALRSRGSRAAARSSSSARASSSRIFWRSRPVRRCSCMSRIACAWSCDSLNCGHQAVARLGRALRPANQLDDLVEVIERDLEAFEDVGARLGLAQLELGAAPDDLAPELDEVLDDLEQAAAPSAGRRRSPA